MKMKLVFSFWCAVALGATVWGADEAAKTWELTLPENEADVVASAVVTLSDGNYKLKGYIRSVEAKTLAIGVPGNPNSGSAGLALFTDESGKYVGTGDLDLRGAITVDGVASDWKITRIQSYAFHAAAKAPWNECWLPTTLTEMGGSTFQSTGITSGHNVFHIVAPVMTGDLPNNTFLNGRGPRTLELKIPKVTCLGGYWNRTGYDDFLKDTDVSDWDLSSVQMIATHGAKGKYDPGFLLRWGQYRGTLRLPSLKWLNPQSLQNSKNLNALEAGTKGTLEYVGRFAAQDCASLGSVVLGGKPTGWTISTNAFHSANITNVTFLTVPPTYEEPDSVIFGTEDTPARSMSIHIPARDTAGWTSTWGAYAAQARPATDAERADYAARFGAYAAQGLVGVVPASLFRTAQEQWLVCGHSSAQAHTVKASLLDPRFDTDTVAVSPAPDAQGRYAPGSQITFTAVADAARGRFVRWRGKGVPESEEENPTLTLTVDRDLDLVAQFAHDWTFELNDPAAGFAAGAKGTIDNGIWKLNVAVADAAARTFTYGTGKEGGAWTDKGEGQLDLNGRIFMADGAELTPAGYSGDCFKGPVYNNAQLIADARFPRAIVMRETPALALGQQFRCGDYTGAFSVTNLIFETPDLGGELGTDIFCAYRVTAGRLRLPKITRIPSNYSWNMSDVDVTDWRLDSVTDVVGEVKGAWGVFFGIFAKQPFTGTLHLPALATVQTNAFRAASKMQAIELGSNTVVTSIGSKAFNGCTELSRIQLRAGKELTVGADAFTGTPNLKVLEFTFEAPNDPTAVDNMLVGTTESIAASANPPVIYASRMMGWNSGKLANIRAASAAELAAKPASILADGSLMGVWETADGVAKAWVVHRASAEDPKGTVLVLR